MAEQFSSTEPPASPSPLPPVAMWERCPRFWGWELSAGGGVPPLSDPGVLPGSQDCPTQHRRHQGAQQQIIAEKTRLALLPLPPTPPWRPPWPATAWGYGGVNMAASARSLCLPSLTMWDRHSLQVGLGIFLRLTVALLDDNIFLARGCESGEVTWKRVT